MMMMIIIITSLAFLPSSCSLLRTDSTCGGLSARVDLYVITFYNYDLSLQGKV
jgi:hypothetical protein